MSTISSSTYGSLVHFLWRNIPSSPLPILKLGCLLSLLSCRGPSRMYLSILTSELVRLIHKDFLPFRGLPFILLKRVVLTHESF